MKISIGFTGTQRGMTDEQKYKFALDIVQLNPTEFHHGDCIGADADAHDLVRALLPNCKIIGHPPKKDAKRAFKECDELRTPKEYLDRNKDIVDESMFMFGTPGEMVEQLRSGTWSTIRYATKKNKPKSVILPDGSVL